ECDLSLSASGRTPGACSAPVRTFTGLGPGPHSSSGGSWDTRSGIFTEDLLHALPRLPELEDFPWSAHELRELVRRACGWDAFTGDAVKRLSALLRNPLLRIAREAQRLSAVHRQCTRLEVQSAVRIVLSAALAEPCVAAAVRAVSLHCMSGTVRSCGLVLSVGRFFRWMVDTRVSMRVREYAAVYLTACTERLVEEVVVRALQPEASPVSSSRLDSAVDLDPELWPPLQVHAQLLSGRNAHGQWRHEPVFIPAASVSATLYKYTYNSSCRKGETKKSGLSLTSGDLVSRAMRLLFRPRPSPPPSANHMPVSWSPDALRTLYYFVSASQADPVEILPSPNMTLTKVRPAPLLPPLSEWIRVSLVHAEHRRSSAVDRDDVRQASRLLLQLDCEPRLLRCDSSVSSWCSLDAGSALERFSSDLGFRMLHSGRADLLPQASALLGEKGLDTMDERGMTALMYASAAGDEALVQVLVQAGAQLDLQIPGSSARHPSVSAGTRHWTALTLAVLHSHLSVAQLLLEAGADVEAQVSGVRAVPRRHLCSWRDYEMVSLLLSYGADPLLPVHHGSSLSEDMNCFSCAAAHGHRNIVQRLVLQPEPCREDVLSLEEILAEGVDPGHSWEQGAPRGGTLRVCKARLKALQQASYYSAEHGYLEVTLDIRKMGVAWSMHSWLQSVLRAHELNRDGVLISLLQDFSSICSENYSPEFALTGVPLLFTLLHSTKDYVLLQCVASVLSQCYGAAAVPPVPALDTALSTQLDVHFLNNPEMSDVTFMIEGRPFFAHRVLLISASDRWDTFKILPWRVMCLLLMWSGGALCVFQLLPVSAFFRLRALQRSCEAALSGSLTVDNAVSLYRTAKVITTPHITGIALKDQDRDRGSTSGLLTDLETALKDRMKTLYPSCRG
uniref:Ankyrin repeat and BTB (POZ) domain containing 2a n=1 Tax=Neogobius melanostomus TaxID=47308 RepID=A0A8C6S200_9GOBI